MQQYQNEFSMQLQEYQINQQERNQQMQELGFALDLMNFETNDQKAQREWDYRVKQQEYQNGNINSKDYQTRYKAALSSVQNLLSQYPGIPMVRSAEQMAEDILKGMDTNGTTLGAELSKINQQIQSKPEYKYMYNQTFLPAATSTTWWWFSGKSIKIWDMELFEYGDKRLTADEIKSMFGAGGTGAAKPYTAVDKSAFSLQASSSRDKNLWWFLRSIWKTGTKWWQCGKFVNDYLQKIGIGRYYDNELSTKLNSVNDYTPQVWSIAVFDYWHKSSDWINHWHVGIVTQVYEDGTFDVLDSNYGWDKKIQKRHVYPESASFKWFFNPSKWPLTAWSTNAGTTVTTQQSNNAFTTAWNNIALNLGSVSATNTFNEQLKNYVDNGNYTNAFEYITTQAKQSADSDTRQAINSAESAISALVSIQQWLDAFQAAWGNTWIFAGTAEQVANKIWKTTNPELKKLATQINVAIQKYRQAISWAAFSEQEAAEYAAIFPSTKNSKALNTALIEWTLDTMLQNLNSSYASILGTDTYTSLLQAYQSTTGNIYDYYWWKQALTKYLKDNGYFVWGKSSWTTSGTRTTTTTNKYDPKKAVEDVIAKFKLK